MNDQFPNYMDVKPKVPHQVWILLRVISTLSLFTLLIILINSPHTGLFIFWGLCVPVLPLVFFVAPGLWRNICPLASSSQLPRELGFTKSLPAAKWIKNYGYFFSILLGFVLIPARHVIFHQSATALVVLLVSVVVIPFIMGIFYKGKSGWCTTLCPVMPFQRAYGQTPFFKVRNHHCRPCVGCTENCYDFNPATSYVLDMNSKDKHQARYRRLFIGSLPGLIHAFYSNQDQSFSLLFQYLHFIENIAISAFVFQILISVIKLNEAKIAMLFSAIALNMYYYYVIPLSLVSVSEQFHFSANSDLSLVLQIPISLLTIIWVVRTYRLQEKIIGIFIKKDTPSNALSKSLIEQRTSGIRSKLRIKLIGSDRILLADKGENLLQVLERGGVEIESGCRAGACGADPVTLSPKSVEALEGPSSTETRTIKRSGFSINTRFACCITVEQDLEITIGADKKITISKSTDSDSSQKESHHIVVIGGGVSAYAFIDTIRNSADAECYRISLFSDENIEYYNRMAIAKLFYNNKGTEDIRLPFQQFRSLDKLYLNTKIATLDTRNKKVMTFNKQEYSYDTLVLASGSIPIKPPIPGIDHTKIFVVYKEHEVINARRLIQDQGLKHAVVWGGGILGLETACALAKSGLQVDVLERSSSIMARNLDKICSELLIQQLKNQAVNTICNTTITDVKSTNHQLTLGLNNGTSIKTDILFVCLGFSPNIKMVEKTEIKTNRGILVNETMQSSVDNIYAIGACAEMADRTSPVLWENAAISAELAANQLVGSESLPTVQSKNIIIAKIPGVHLVSAGDIDSIESDTVISSVNRDNFQYKKIIIRNNLINGYILMGYSQLASKMKRWYEQNTAASSVMKEFENG